MASDSPPDLLDESLDRARTIGREQYVANSLFDQGILALLEYRYDDSLPLFVESLDLERTHGDRKGVAMAMLGIGASCAARGDLESAARIVGARRTLQEGREKMFPYEEAAFEGVLTVVADRGDDSEISAALTDGRNMGESDAAAFALATAAGEH